MNLFFIFVILIIFHVVLSKSNEEDQVESRIYNGYTATDAQFPYQGYLSYDGDIRCGGSIIHQNWGMTAAHCVFDSDYPVFTVGTIHTFGSDGIVYSVAKFVVHAKYLLQKGNPFILINDIALMRMEYPIQFDYYKVQPIPLDRDTTANYNNQMATLAGWGGTVYGGPISSVLLYLNTPIMPLSQCRDVAMNWYVDDSLHICLSNAEGKQGCKGDSGSPLVSNGLQIGIASGADTNCLAFKPTLFTKVSTFVPWIQRVLAQHNEYI